MLYALYRYRIYEVVNNQEHLIAEYKSDALPPPQGVTLNLSDFVKLEKPQMFETKVIRVEMWPAKSDKDERLSEEMFVNVFVESITTRVGKTIHERGRKNGYNCEGFRLKDLVRRRIEVIIPSEIMELLEKRGKF